MAPAPAPAPSPAPDSLPDHAASVLTSRHKAKIGQTGGIWWGCRIEPISSQYLPCTGHTDLYMLFNLRAKFRSHGPHPLANPSLFPAPPPSCYQPTIISNAHNVTVFVSGLRSSSYIGGSVVVLLVSCEVFSSRWLSFCIE